MTNTQNTPIESLHTHYPVSGHRVHAAQRQWWDRASHRGGDGIRREIEFLADSTLSLMGERRRHRPWGLAGGEPGSSGEDWLVRSDGSKERLPGKVTVEVAAGDRLLVLTPGGGGWGDGHGSTARRP